MGGDTTVEQPSPPPRPTTGEAIREYAEVQPQLYETALEYMPKYARLAQQISEELYPETAGLQEQLAETAGEGMEEGVPDWMRQEYLSNVRGQLGENVRSPMGADYTSRGLLNLAEERRNLMRNLALSTAGRQQLVQPPSYKTMQPMTPQDVMGFKSSTYAPYASAYSGMYGANAQMAQQKAKRPFMWMQGIGNLMQGAGKMGSGFGWGG